MNKYNGMLSIELQKIFRTKFIYIMLIITLLLCLVMVGAVEIIANVNVGAGISGVFDSPQDGFNYFDVNVKAYEKMIEDGTYKDRYYNNELGAAKRMREYYRYLVDNNLNENGIIPYGTTNIGNNVIDLTRIISGVALTMAVIVVIVIGARNMAGEMSSGAMKMVLIRPVSRSTILTAKMTATIVSGASVFLLFTFIGAMYGMMRFEGAAPTYIMVTESSGMMVSAIGVLALEMLQGLVQLVAYGLLTYCVGIVTRSKTAACVIPLVLVLGGSLISMVLQYVFIGYIEFSFNLNYMSSLQALAGLPRGVSIYSMLAISAVWMALLAGVSYIKFKRYSV